MWTRLLIMFAFLAIPVLWGVAVNGLFDLWSGRDRNSSPDNDRIFPDYQI